MASRGDGTRACGSGCVCGHGADAHWVVAVDEPAHATSSSYGPSVGSACEMKPLAAGSVAIDDGSVCWL